MEITYGDIAICIVLTINIYTITNLNNNLIDIAKDLADHIGMER